MASVRSSMSSSRVASSGTIVTGGSQQVNLLIGKTGVGKSTLLSGLSSKKLYVSDGVHRGTIDPEIVYVDNWLILDTRGLSDMKEGDGQRDEAIIELKKYLFKRKFELSSIVLYIHDPVDNKRIEGDIIRALKLLKQAIKNSHLDNLVVLYRVNNRHLHPKMYLKALAQWKEVADELDCQVRESIPVYAKRDFDDATDQETLEIENIAELKTRLTKHRYQKYFEWKQESCSKCGKLCYVDFDHGPCSYHLDAARQHVGNREYYHSGSLEQYHDGMWSPKGYCSDDGPWQCCNNTNRHSAGCKWKYPCCGKSEGLIGCQERCDKCKKAWSAQCDGFCEKCKRDTKTSPGCITVKEHEFRKRS